MFRQKSPGGALPDLLKPFTFLACPSLTHTHRHTAECILGHRCGQSGQCPGIDQGKHYLQESCLLGAFRSLESHTPVQEAWFTSTKFAELWFSTGLLYDIENISTTPWALAWVLLGITECRTEENSRTLDFKLCLCYYNLCQYDLNSVTKSSRAWVWEWSWALWSLYDGHWGNPLAMVISRKISVKSDIAILKEIFISFMEILHSQGKTVLIAVGWSMKWVRILVKKWKIGFRKIHSILRNLLNFSDWIYDVLSTLPTSLKTLISIIWEGKHER